MLIFWYAGASSSIPSTPKKERSYGNDDDMDKSDEESLNPSTPGSSQSVDGDDPVSGRPTSELIKKCTTPRRKQAEEEYHLIQNLSQSIANKQKRNKREKKE